jgi:hypothetical protein
MKWSVLGLVAALGTSGCFVVSEDDSVVAGDPLDAQLYLTWETRDNAAGVELDCHDIGADTVRVSARNSDAGDVWIDLFDCDLNAGTTFELNAGDYFVDVDLVYCGTDAACNDPDVYSSAPTQGPLSVWYDGEYDLGHFVFLVE